MELGRKSTDNKYNARNVVDVVTGVKIESNLFNSNTVFPFLQQAHKFAIVVELLLGEIPDRTTFRDRALMKTLVPYFQLTKGWCLHYM